jgi:hypothetical protein
MLGSRALGADGSESSRCFDRLIHHLERSARRKEYNDTYEAHGDQRITDIDIYGNSLSVTRSESNRKSLAHLKRNAGFW